MASIDRTAILGNPFKKSRKCNLFGGNTGMHQIMHCSTERKEKFRLRGKIPAQTSPYIH